MKPDATLPNQMVLGWVTDLSAPGRAGKWHTRQGYCVEISNLHFLRARDALANGADEVFFVAQRTQPFSGAYYILIDEKSDTSG
jgi:hypothetical protein